MLLWLIIKIMTFFHSGMGTLIYVKIAIYAKTYGFYWCCFIGIMQISPVSFMAILKYKCNIFSKGNDNIFRNDQ